MPATAVSSTRKDADSIPGSKADFPIEPQKAASSDENIAHRSEDDLVDCLSMASVQGASESKYLGSTSGVSFARVVSIAMNTSITSSSYTSESTTGRKRRRSPLRKRNISDETAMRESFFGLHKKPKIRQAPFPTRALGLKLVNLYFEHSNPMYPILHRGEFMTLLDRVYASGREKSATSRELYMLNIVFAIGAAIFLTEGSNDSSSDEDRSEQQRPSKRQGIGHSKQYRPENYHASAILHLGSLLGASPTSDRPDRVSSGLEDLQAVLLLAAFALLRPAEPGLWYIVGVAVRLGVDLGLHHEDRTNSSSKRRNASDESHAFAENSTSRIPFNVYEHAREGKSQWTRDLRRRLWWCVYSFDRLVSVFVGRPVGISDQVITTDFPSLLDDKYITPKGFHSDGFHNPSYKHTSHHYFRLRLLQSEILQVLHDEQIHQERLRNKGHQNPYINTRARSSFLQDFESFQVWRTDIDRRLAEWKATAPDRAKAGVAFSVQFLELNYWQTIVMLYRQSLTVPPIFAQEYSPAAEFDTSDMHLGEPPEYEDMIFLRVAEAGMKVLRLYRQLHLVHLVNYTYLDTHQIFMAGK